MMRITRKKKKGRLEISMKALYMGKDLCVILTGSDTPHLGAVTTGSFYENLQTYTFEHHKDNVVTEMFSDILRKEYSGNFTVCCGIHLDNITSKEIRDSIDLCREMAEELCCLFKNEDKMGEL